MKTQVLSERLFAVLLTVLVFGTLVSLGMVAGGCGEEEAKSCTTRDDCGPCEFCNMGKCKPEPNCTPCESDLDCGSDEYCDLTLGRCVERAATDGDQEVDDVVDTPTEADDLPDEPVVDGDDDLDEVSTEQEGEVEEYQDFIDLPEPDIEEFETVVQCDMTGEQGPHITIIPTEEVVDFGAVMVGDYKVEYVTICNSGTEPFAVTNIQLEHGTTPEFQLSHDPLPFDNVEPGTGRVIAVIYQPRDNQEDRGQMIILSTADRQEVRVDLIGSIKPVGRLQVRPEVLQFQHHGGTKVLALDNVGVAQLSILKLEIPDNPDFRIEDPDSDNDGSVEQGPFPIEPGAFMNVSISFTNREGAQDGVLKIYWHNGESNQYTEVPLQVGGAGICAQPDAGPDQTVAPLAVVQLDGSASTDPNDVQEPGEEWYFWDIVDKPQGAFNVRICESVVVDAQNHQVICNNNVQGRWSTVARPQFFAELAGRYVISLKINPHDDPGCDNVDTVTVMAVPDETIHVQLRWTMPHNDHDLHLVRYHLNSWDPNRVGCFTRGDSDNEDDCHWLNCNTRNETETPCPPRGCPGPSNAPDWGVVGDRSDDPTLDIDDIPGTGPENINLSLPELGDYFVAVENYSGSDAPELTVKIWIFGVLQANFTGVRIPQSVHHWNVCWLHVLSPTEITIEPIGIIKPSVDGSTPDCNPTQQ